MVTVKDICSSSANALNTGWHTLGSGAKKGFHLVCLSKPQNTWGRYAVQTARYLYIAQTIATLVALGVRQYGAPEKTNSFKAPEKAKYSLGGIVLLSGASVIPGLGIISANLQRIFNCQFPIHIFINFQFFTRN